jgi:hypothetical protein
MYLYKLIFSINNEIFYCYFRKKVEKLKFILNNLDFHINEK